MIVFLTADALGVLPPVSRLTKEGAMYHFMSGYTSKLAGTERGIKEPKSVFSQCFGAPFMPRPASVYAKLLGEKINQHKYHSLPSQYWMVWWRIRCWKKNQNKIQSCNDNCCSFWCTRHCKIQDMMIYSI